MIDRKHIAAILTVSILALSWKAQAQPDSEPFRRDRDPCLQAQTPAQCEPALPACERVLKAMAQTPSDLQVDGLHRQLLNKTAWCENQLGRYALAEGHYRATLELDQRRHGSEHPDVASSLNDLAGVLFGQGKHEAAETLLRQALAMRQKLLGTEHPDVASSLNDLALVLESQGKYEAAETLHRQALAMRQKLLGAEHPDVAKSLNNLANVLSRQGKYEAAEAFHRQALAMRQKLLGAEHPDVAKSLNDLANVLSRQRKDESAETLIRQALAMRQKLLGTEHPDVAKSLNNLAAVLDSQGKYEVAELSHRQALAMWQKLLGAEHPDVAKSLNNLALVLENQGKYEAAETLHRQALAMWQKLLGAEHPDVAGSLNNLAIVLKLQGKYEAAETLHRQVLAMMQKLLGTEHPGVAISLNNLAIVLKLQGKYEAAETLHRQVLAMMQKRLGAEHLDVARSLNNLADVLESQGKHEAAETLYRQALAMRQKRLGAEHPYVAQSLNNLAAVLSSQGKYEAAETLHRQALAMSQKRLGAEHPHVALSLNSLADVLYLQGKYEAAETLHRQALAMRQKLLGTEHPHVAESLHNLALVLERQGKYEAAETLHWQALAMWQKLLGAEHPDVATSLNRLAVVLIRRGQFPEALQQFTQAKQIEESVLRATTSETRMRTALDKVRAHEDVLYGLLLEQPNDAKLKRLVMTMTLLRKGRAAEAGTMANRLLHQSQSNPETKQRYDQWRQVRQQREALLYGGGGHLPPQVYQARLRELSQQADDLESQLAATMPELRKLQPPKFDQILAAVAKQLPSDGALLEIVRAKPRDFTAKGMDNPWKTPHYLALVMTADQQIAVHDLGEAVAVDHQVQVLLSALRSPASNPVQSAKLLYDQVLRPLLPQAVKHLYLSLDGALSLVPFDALHDSADYLLGRISLHYLTSGRDLLRTDAYESKQSALLLADPDFGQAGPAQPNGGTETFYRRLSGLKQLPGAQEEAKQIGPLLHVTPIVGKAATEPVVRAAQAPWVFHIASHGLFLGGRDFPSSGGRGGTFPGNPFFERKGVLIGDFGGEELGMSGDTDSLSRSALVLANAVQGEKAPSAAEDGLLTAEEVRSLDLFGTQLVVLSACDSGQGELSVGQGVYGLRRAFLVAGAETLVTSLWQVNDAATGKLMELYYQKLLKEKKGRLEGMQEAMKEMKAKYNHPYYWAPFLVVGSDGPIRPPANLNH